MDAIQTKQSTSFFPLIQHLKIFQFVFTQLTNKYWSLQMSHSGQLPTNRVSLSWVARKRRGPSPSQTLPYLCHSCVILPGSEILKKTKAVEADDRGYHKIAVRIKEKGTSKECKFHSSSQQSPRSLKNQRQKKQKHFECLRRTDLSLSSSQASVLVNYQCPRKLDRILVNRQNS